MQYLVYAIPELGEASVVVSVIVWPDGSQVLLLVKLSVVVGITTSFVFASVTFEPWFPAGSVRYVVRVTVPSLRPERSRFVICWLAVVMVPEPVTGVPDVPVME